MVVNLLYLAFMLIIRHSPSMPAFRMRIRYFDELVEKGANLQKRGGVSLPLLPEGILPHPAQFSPTSVYSQSPLYVTTFTCLSFCLNLYVLDKKKNWGMKKKKKTPKRRAVPLQPWNPSAGQPMAIQGRKNQMGAMLLAFHSSRKSFQLLP